MPHKPIKPALNVSLTTHLVGFVEEQVESGRFSSASEVVRAALRLLERDLKPPGHGHSASLARGAATAPAASEPTTTGRSA